MSSSVAVPNPDAPASLLLRIGAMFCFETACMAAYVPLMALFMQHQLALTPYQMALVYATGPIMALIAPLCAGFVADRLLPAERSMSVINVLRALGLFFAARAGSFQELLVAMAVVGFCTTPSHVLASSILFHHVPQERSFGFTRVWGVAAWMITVWLVSAYLGGFAADAQLAELRVGLGIAALIALCNAAYALTLPHTPPAQLGKGPLEAVRSLGMLRQRDLLTLVVVATAAGAMMQSNMILQGLYFTSPSGLGLSVSAATKASTVSQMLELALFPLLGPILRRFKLRTLLLIGVGAWPLRFLANALGEPTALVVATQLLHGFNVVFGIFAVQMAANRLAPAGRRASTQGLLTTGSAGVGALSGQLGCGVLLAAFTSSAGTDWRSIYAAPLVLGALATGVLFFGFRPQAARPEVAA